MSLRCTQNIYINISFWLMNNSNSHSWLLEACRVVAGVKTIVTRRHKLILKLLTEQASVSIA